MIYVYANLHLGYQLLFTFTQVWGKHELAGKDIENKQIYNKQS